MIHQTRQASLIFIGQSIQKQQNTLSSQVLMEHSPGKIISWVTNQVSVNLRKLKSYQASFLTTNATRLEYNYRKKNCKKHKHTEAKQFNTK